MNEEQAIRELSEYDFRNVMRAAVKLYGHDANMESCKDVAELVENIGSDGVPALIEELQGEEY